MIIFITIFLIICIYIFLIVYLILVILYTISLLENIFLEEDLSDSSSSISLDSEDQRLPPEFEDYQIDSD